MRGDADAVSDSMSSRDAGASGTLARVLRQMHSLDKGAANDPRALQAEDAAQRVRVFASVDRKRLLQGAEDVEAGRRLY